MKTIRSILAGAALLLLCAAAAVAQTAPNWTFGYVPTTAQWNAVFAGKQDTLGFVPMNVAGGSFTGRVVTAAPGASTAGFNLTPGSSPASPSNGDLWTTSSGLFVRINGATVGPLGSTGANTYTDTQTINPPTGTLNRGLVINQTGPTSGTSVGPWSGNIINSTFGATVTGSSDPFFDNGAWQTWVAAHRVNFTVGGASLGGEPVGAGFYQLIANTNAVGASDGDFIGLAGEAWANATITNGAFHGLVGAAIIGASANIRAMNGLFAEADILTGGVAVARRGINIVSQGNITATGPSDTAINIATSSSPAGFKNLIIIDTAGGAIQPIQSTGNILTSDGAFTVANMFALPNMTVTGKIFDLAKLQVSGIGLLTAGGGTADANTGAMVNAAVASGGVAALISQANSSTGFDGFHTNNSTGVASLFAVVGEPSSTQTIFGQANASWGEVVSSGSSSNGLLLGALTNSPVLFGTNNTARMQITGAGLVGIGSFVTPDSRLTVNNNTGPTVAAGVANDLHLVAPDSAFGGVLSDAFDGEVAFIGRASAATRASKTAVGAGISYVAFAGQTWDGSGYASNSVLEYQTLNAQSGSDHSSKARLRLVPSGSTTLIDVMLWGPGVAIGSGAADPGAGNLNLGGGKLQNNGTDPTGTGAYVRAASASMSALTVTGSFTATGLVTNADLANSSVTINGTTISLGGSGTITAAATSLAVGTTTITSGTTLGVLFNNAGVLANTAAGTNGQLFLGVTSGAPAFATMSGDATITNAGVLSLATAQPAVHTWALAQTFTVAPVFTDQSGSRTALGLGTMATQAASAVAITGGTLAGLTGLAIRDTSAAFDVTLAATSTTTLTAGRTLTFDVGNVAHTLKFGTTANTITFPNLASFTVITNGDTGSVTNAMLANSAVTVNGTSISLGASGTVTAAAGTLTGATLASGVTASSLTSLGTIASLTATQINAFTLAGTVSGGGNQINNVIIGNTTPLAGSFTTVSASTSMTSPLHIGGSGTTGTQLTLQTTTGVGTTDAFAFKGGNNGATTFGSWNSTGLGIGAVAPDSLLTVNANTAASVAPPTGTYIHVVGADGAVPRITIDAFAGIPVVAGQVALGTQAAKVAVNTALNLFTLGASGWSGSAYTAAGQISFHARETFSGSASGTSFSVYTTPLTTTGVAESTRFQPSGGLAVGATAIATDKGIGTVALDGNLFFTVAAKTVTLKQGANGSVGTFVCTSGGTITISNTNVAISDAIVISLNTVGGSITTNPTVNAITAATSFTAKCATSDTSTYNYAIIKNAA